MGDFSTNKHYSDDAVRGWRERRRDEGRRGREGRLMGEINGRKRERAFMCKRLCCVDTCCHRHISFCINLHPPSDEDFILS